ncbi:MAG: glycosyltransferase family 39 protein [Lachnospiraceae bacterium]|nr:glycosyltransferase family 39 protein [Lachnospiraceae bacterium]MDD3614846.1 glycosyltransferase family 39 protein [Lachnospiraceae bacterium]
MGNKKNTYKKIITFMILALAGVFITLCTWKKEIGYLLHQENYKTVMIDDFASLEHQDCEISVDGNIVITGDDPWIEVPVDCIVSRITVCMANMISSAHIETQVYYDNGSDYHEDNSKTQFFYNGENTVYAEQFVEKIRLDFIDVEKNVALDVDYISVNPEISHGNWKALFISAGWSLGYLLLFILMRNQRCLFKGNKKKEILIFLIIMLAAAGFNYTLMKLHLPMYLCILGGVSVMGFSLFWQLFLYEADSKRKVCCFLTGAFFLYVLWAATQAFGHTPDEGMRYLIPQYIMNHGRLPMGTDPEIIETTWGTSYGFIPTVSYIPAGILMKIISILGGSGKLIYLAARIPSCIYAVTAVSFSYKTGKLLFSEKSAWLFTCLTALLPQFIFISSYVNCDAFSMMSVTILFWAVLEGKRKNWDIKNLVMIGTGVSLCLLSYYNSYGIIAAAVLYCVLSVCCQKYKCENDSGELSFSRKKVREEKALFIMKCAGIIAITVALLTGWWFVRNYLLYDGDLLGLRTSRATMEQMAADGMKPSQRISYMEAGYSLKQMLIDGKWIEKTSKSFVGAFSYMSIWMSTATYWIYGIVILLGVLGNFCCYPCVTGKWSKDINPKDKEFGYKKSVCDDAMCKESKYEEKGWIGYLALIAAIGLTVFISLYYSYVKDFQPQGRYILPLMPALGILITIGYDKWLRYLPEKFAGIIKTVLTAGWFIMGMLAYVLYIAPVYY